MISTVALLRVIALAGALATVQAVAALAQDDVAMLSQAPRAATILTQQVRVISRNVVKQQPELSEPPSIQLVTGDGQQADVAPSHRSCKDQPLGCTPWR